jgi:hypothetical protein
MSNIVARRTLRGGFRRNPARLSVFCRGWIGGAIGGVVEGPVGRAVGDTVTGGGLDMILSLDAFLVNNLCMI